MTTPRVNSRGWVCVRCWIGCMAVLLDASQQNAADPVYRTKVSSPFDTNVLWTLADPVVHALCITQRELRRRDEVSHDDDRPDGCHSRSGYRHADRVRRR